MNKFKDKLQNKVKNIDDIFNVTDPNRVDDKTILDIEISKLHTFQNHPFKVKDNDETMIEMIASIKKQGVIYPIIIRQKDDVDNEFEIIAGHRRTRACELLGIETIPAIIKKMNNEESTILMVDSNIQREELLFSEKAFAYKMKLNAIKQQGKQINSTSSQVGTKLKRSDEIIANNSSDSRNQIQRYIRLTELIAELLDMTDERKLPFTTAVELSYLKKNEQKLVLKKINTLRKPTLSEAKKLKECSNDGDLTEEFINGLLSSTDIKKTESKDRPLKNMLKKHNILDKYFSENADEDEIEKFILEVLESYFEK